MQSVFISRQLKDDSPLKLWVKKNKITLYNFPLISQSPINFYFFPNTAWIFFSSKNAIKYFFNHSPKIHASTQLGVLSAESALYLQKEFNLKANFIGSGNDVAKIGRKFKTILNNQSVLFPQAQNSLKTIQNQLLNNTKQYNLIVYKSQTIKWLQIPNADIIILTSPLNVKSYFEQKPCTFNKTYIAIGLSTKEALEQKHIKNILVPNNFSEAGILEKLETLI